MENEAHEIFCALRSPAMSMPNLWEFPGGKVEAGENPFQAIRREMREEFACTVEPEPEIFCDTIHEYDALIVRLLTIRCHLVEGALHATEHASVRWVGRENLLSLVWAPADLPTVAKLMGTGQGDRPALSRIEAELFLL